jgi:hypothetical protein
MSTLFDVSFNKRRKINEKFKRVNGLPWEHLVALSPFFFSTSTNVLFFGAFFLQKREKSLLGYNEVGYNELGYNELGYNEAGC